MWSFTLRRCRRAGSGGRKRARVIAAGTCLAALAPAALGAATYHVTLLGDLGKNDNGLTSSIAYAVNGSGITVGKVDKPTAAGGVPHAVLWAAGQTAATELGGLAPAADADGALGYGYAINGSGVVAGAAEKYSGGVSLGLRAVRWAAGQTAATELGNLGTDSFGFAQDQAAAIDGAGNVYGQALKYTGGSGKGGRPVRWAAGQTAATELGVLGTNTSGVTNGAVTGANAGGTAVGLSDKYSGNTRLGSRGVMWAAGQSTPTELGNLGTNSSGFTESNAKGINAGGTAVGYAWKYSGNTSKGARAVRWAAGQTTATELGVLGLDSGGGGNASADAIDTAGNIVGYGDFYSGGIPIAQHAVLWRAGQTAATDLNDLIDAPGAWVLEEAFGINDSGVIVGWGQYRAGGTGPAQLLAFRLDPLPEPSVLTPLALAGMLLVRRRRRPGLTRGAITP